MEIQVNKEDILLIGHTAYKVDGNLAIICSIESCHLEYILLRNILLCFGTYNIIDTYEKFSDEQNLLSSTDRVFITDLPFEKYLSIDFHWITHQ